MPLLFERAGHWKCEHTDRGIFFVHMLLPNVMDVAVLDEFMDQARPHLQRLAPVLYLNNATDIQGGSLSIQWRLAQHMKMNAPYIKKSALYGLTPRKAFLVRSVIRASGRSNVRVFETRDECEAWLLA